MDSAIFLAQSEQIIGWLTPVWLFSLGLGIGYLCVLLVRGVIFLLSRVPGLNRLNDQDSTRYVAVAVVSLLLMVAIGTYAVLSGLWWRLEEESSQILLCLFGVGGAVVLGFGFIALVSKKRYAEVFDRSRSGITFWVTIICISAIVFVVIGLALAPVDGFGYFLIIEKPEDIFSSMWRLPFTGLDEITVEVPPGETTTVDAGFLNSELKRFRFDSTEVVRIASFDLQADTAGREYFYVDPDISPGRVYSKPATEDTMFPGETTDTIWVENQGRETAIVNLAWVTSPVWSQVAVVPRIVLGVVGIYLLYWMFCAALPKISAIATATYKTEISQPVFILLAVVGCVFVVGSIYIPYYTFGEDIKMFKVSALTLIRVLGIFLAIWAASKSVAEEIEGRTALTILSKPVGRRQFILGKFCGIGLAIALLFVLLGSWFTIWLCFKPMHDAIENSTRDFNWLLGFSEAIWTMPGLFLAFLESLVFAAISIAISTRLGNLANFMICFAIYVLGHLTPVIVQSAEVVQAFEPVVVFGQFLSVVVPVLDHFDVEPAIIGEVEIPLAYMGWAIIYCLIYGTIALLLSLVLFEDRDLA